MIRRLALLVAVSAVLVFSAGPMLWPIGISLRGEDAAWSVANYRRALEGRHLLRALANSAIVAGATTLLSIATGALASFVLAKPRFPGGRAILGGALAASMLPPIATVGPLYLVIRGIGLRDDLGGLVLTYSAFALPLTLFLLTAFFREIPDALYEAARIDGCSPWQTLRWIIAPLAAPGIATAAILVFIFSYNEFLYALTFTSSPEQRTVPVAIALFASDRKEPWGEIAAASVMAAVPLVLVALIFQRRIVSAITQGAVKE